MAIAMKGRELAGRCRFLLTLFCVILNAASGDPPWAVSAIRDTGLPHPTYENLAAMSANGDVYSATWSCPSPTLIAGDANTHSSCVTKVDATGRQVFAVEIGSGAVTALVVGATGDAYIAGGAGAGFPATAGAYEQNPPGAPDPFVCRLSGSDGHPLYCTFIDVLPSNGALAVDASASAYIAGICGDNFHTICVEKLNPLGTALVYKANVFTALRWLRGVAAVDGPGNLFVAQQDAGIVKVGPTGALEGTSGPLNGVPVALVSDSSGAPELVLQENVEPGVLRLLRWTPDLAAVLFDKELLTGALVNGTGSILNIGIDSSETTTILGASDGANLATFHPTQPCNATTAARSVQPTAGDSAFLARFDANGALLQSTYLGILPGFIYGAPILFRGGDASVVASVVYSPEGPLIPSANWKILNLRPASSEIGLSCIGDGAAFRNARTVSQRDCQRIRKWHRAGAARNGPTGPVGHLSFPA